MRCPHCPNGCPACCWTGIVIEGEVVSATTDWPPEADLQREPHPDIQEPACPTQAQQALRDLLYAASFFRDVLR